MTNADKFKNIFGLYATELWSMPEKDFLKWLNSKVVNCSEIPNNSDTISRQAMLDGIDKLIKIHFDRTVVLYKARQVAENLPSVQPERKDAVEKAVAVEAICDELMSRFDVSATYGYDFAEAVINRMEAMAKELEKGEQE